MRALAPFLIGSALMVAGCGEIGEIEVEDAWVRLPAVTGRPAAAYFHVRTGARSETLVKVTAAVAARVEMHETMSGHHAMARMAPMGPVEIPAGSSVTFAPGGKHVMLFELSPKLKPGGTAALQLHLASGTILETQALLVAAGDPAPAARQ